MPILQNWKFSKFAKVKNTPPAVSPKFSHEPNLVQNFGSLFGHKKMLSRFTAKQQ